MDSQHRHELDQNELAGWLDQKIQAIQPQLPVIVAGLVAAAVAYAGWGMLSQSRESGRAAAWENYTLAIESGVPSLEMLDLAATESSDPDVANLARITWADGKLQRGCAAYFFNRPEANKELDRAVTAYEALLKSPDEAIANRAQFGLARVQEIRGQVEEAVKSYTLVTGSLGEIAKTRLAELSSDRAKEDFTWLASAERTGPASTADPSSVLNRPNANPDEISLPEAEESTADTIDDILNKAGLNEEEAKPEAETPAAEGETPAAEATKPESPAAAETPAAPKAP